MLLANISLDNVVFASGGCCVLVNRLLSSPPTWTSVPVPTVSQGLVGKQQWKSCNYSPNIPGQKHIIPSLEQWNAERAELTSLLSLMWGLEGSAHNVWFGLILPRPSSPFPHPLGFFSPPSLLFKPELENYKHVCLLQGNSTVFWWCWHWDLMSRL